MRLYIAGPMSGLPEFNYPAFSAAEDRLLAAGYGTLNPVRAEDHNPTPGVPQPWTWYMRHALRMVTNADGLALLDGWENSKGARTEVYVARKLQMDARPIAEWLERAP